MTASQKAAALQLYQQTLLAAQMQTGQIQTEQVQNEQIPNEQIPDEQIQTEQVSTQSSRLNVIFELVCNSSHLNYHLV